MRMHRRERQAHQILEKHLPFYANLTLAYKAEFRKRVNRFIRSKTIRGGKGFKIEFEHVVAVAGSAIQVSFGNGKYLLSTFNTIIIYEKVYQHPITKNYHRGEVNPNAGIIVVSWEDFVYGYSTDEDNLNVGLHEMAHAYYFEVVKNRKEYISDYDLLSKFMFVSEYEIIKIRKNQSTLFRNYAGENVFEFFAVSVEYFFEDGPEFREKLPKLYRQMCLLLNQDTADGSARGFNHSKYFENTNILNFLPNKRDIKVNNGEFKMNILVKALLYKTVFGIVLLFTFSQTVLENILEFNTLLAVIGVLNVGLLIYKYTSKIFATNTHLFIVYYTAFGKQIKGIPFKGIVSVSMRREFEGDYLINYSDKGVLKHIKIGTNNRKAMYKFERFLIGKSIMFKFDGLRKPRIRSWK